MAGFGRPDLTRTLQTGVLVIFDAPGPAARRSVAKKRMFA